MQNKAVQIESMWADPAYDQRFADFAYSIVAEIDEKAKAAGLYYPFNYINDAGFNQSIFTLYGGGKSLPKMRKIATLYGVYIHFSRQLFCGKPYLTRISQIHYTSFRPFFREASSFGRRG
jgi:hypothetical protein